MRIGQTLFPLKIEPGISQVHPWKELLATGAQPTWLYKLCLYVLFVNLEAKRKET
jgi:hypothetical protein